MAFILLEIRILDLIDPRKPIPFAVLMLLLAASVISVTFSLAICKENYAPDDAALNAR